MIQVRDECGPHFHQQRLEFGILGAWNQRLVDRLQDRLVVGDLVIDVGLVEGVSRELLERGQIVIAAFLQTLAGGARLRVT